MHAPVDAGRLAHTKLGLLVHGNALAKALISHPAKPLAVACVSADGRMSSWASAEWHSLVEHVGHRLKLILLRRLHLQQSRSARPSAIKKSSVAVQFVRRAAFSSHKWQVKSSQEKNLCDCEQTWTTTQARAIVIPATLQHPLSYGRAGGAQCNRNTEQPVHAPWRTQSSRGSLSHHLEACTGPVPWDPSPSQRHDTVTAPTSSLISARGTEHLHARTYTPSPWHARLARARGTAPLPAPPHRPMHK